MPYYPWFNSTRGCKDLHTSRSYGKSAVISWHLHVALLVISLYYFMERHTCLHVYTD